MNEPVLKDEVCPYTYSELISDPSIAWVLEDACGELYKPIQLVDGTITYSGGQLEKDFITTLTGSVAIDFAQHDNFNNLLSVLRAGILQDAYQADSNKLLGFCIRFPDAKLHIATALESIAILQDHTQSTQDKIQLARCSLYTLVPLMRAYELSHLVSALEWECCQILDSNVFNKALRIAQKRMGRYPTTRDISLIMGDITTAVGNVKFDLEGRAKSVLSLARKSRDKRDLRDIIALRLSIDSTSLSERNISIDDRQGISHFIQNEIFSSLAKQGFIIEFDPEDDSYVNPKPYNPKYKALKVYITPPTMPNGLLPSPIELQITTVEHNILNRIDHPWFKHIQSPTKHLGEKDSDVYLLGDVAQNLYRRGRHGITEYLQRQTAQRVAEISKRKILSTRKGNHTIFLRNNGSLDDQLAGFVHSINSKISFKEYQYLITRGSNGNAESFVYDPRVNRVRNRVNGQFVRDFHLSDFDQITILNDNLTPYISSNDALNIIAKEQNEYTLLSQLRRMYPYISIEQITEIRQRLQVATKLKKSSVQKTRDLGDEVYYRLRKYLQTLPRYRNNSQRLSFEES